VRSRAAILTAVATLAITLAGCGSGANDTLSKSELIDRADAVCKDVNDRTNALPAPANIKSAAGLLRKTLDILESGLKRLRDLKPPGNSQRSYEAWVAKNVALAKQAKRAQVAAAHKDERGLQRAIADASRIHNQAGRLAAKLGFKVCAARRRAKT
jgi:hypothetical protein